MQPWHTLFPVWNQSVLPVASWTAYGFRRRQVRWSGIPISLRTCQFVVIHTFKGHIVNEAEVDVFLEFPCFLYDPVEIGNLISGSSAFFKPNLYIWKFSVHVLMKPALKDFEHYLASMWIEHNFTVFWTFFGIALLWHWNENWPEEFVWGSFTDSWEEKWKTREKGKDVPNFMQSSRE